MNKLNVIKFGMAFGITGAVFYMGCMILMLTVGQEGTIQFFNTLLHGLDVSGVIRPEVPLWEAAIGLIQTLIVGWLAGACIAGFYNASLKKDKTS